MSRAPRKRSGAGRVSAGTRTAAERANRDRVLGVFADGVPHTIPDVVRIAKVARGTATRYIDLAVEAGRLRSMLPQAPGGPTLYIGSESLDPTRPLATVFDLMPKPTGNVVPRYVRGMMADEEDAAAIAAR